ncbi:nucleotidyltransferase domain-containing protein [Streptomyces sp. NPDC057460]|uniref:nucleotidyltransferase domain-containing protein n=1 Tax=Streptomyces sp. NPDC057460 TaxID=3346141 RepID=UPI00369F3399
MGDTRVDDRGPAEDGTIGREGSLSRVPAAFAPVVEAARSRITDAFGAAQLQSAYLYGSIPRGTAIPGGSDLDLLLALRAEPTESDRAGTRAVEATLDASSSRRHRGVRGDLRPVLPGADRAHARRRSHRRHPLDGPGSPHHAHRRPGAVAGSRVHRGARREGASPLT